LFITTNLKISVFPWKKSVDTHAGLVLPTYLDKLNLEWWFGSSLEPITQAA